MVEVKKPEPEEEPARSLFLNALILILIIVFFVMMYFVLFQ